MVKELELALQLARSAGEAILQIREEGFSVHEKSGNQGPVTRADHAADQIIRQGLLSAFPDDGLLTEESPDDLERLKRSRVWIVDPLDGTRQFVAREPEFAVMIGLSIEGRAELGVIHLPCENWTLAAVGGEGCFEYSPGGEVRRLRLDPAPPPGREPIIAISRSHAISRTRRAVDHLQPCRILQSGSVGRKAVLVATGRADAYITLASHSSHWDACAADVVVREAGGVFCDTLGAPLRYNTPEIRNRGGLLACRLSLFKPALAAAAAVRTETAARENRG